METYSDINVREWGPGYVYAVHGGVLVQINSVCDLLAVRAVREVLRNAQREILATIVVFEGQFQLPNHAAREELDLFAKELGSRPTAVVYEGDGFIVAAIRALHAGYMRLTNQKLRPRTFGTLSEAVSWLAVSVRQGSDLADLESYIVTLRQRFHEQGHSRSKAEAPGVVPGA